MSIRHKKLHLAIIAVVAVIVVLMWPVGTWVQGREYRIGDSIVPDVIYLVAGAKAQNRRVEALKSFLVDRKGQDTPVVLIGNDVLIGSWSRAQQRNLSMAEHAVEKLGFGEIVPGTFGGTDAEMEILAGCLRERSEIQNIALVTSLFHVRRTVDRLNEYADGEINILAIDIEPRCKDRMPWIVLLELGKMARDRMNLSRAQLLSRTRRP